MDNLKVIVRKAKADDFESVQQIQKTGGDAVQTNGDVIEMVDMEIQASNPNGIFGVAELNGEIIGFIYGDKLAAHWAMSSYFVVKTEYRGTDAARKLGQWFIDECKSRGAKYVLCYVEKDNPKLINFYRRFGFDSGAIEYVEMIKEI
ncbi:MAG: GNAT family N-acetyltransferase [Rickettsiales bacterium]|jgi:ribosomal protein S18 acetylase RimI-like enzyme|nr:GNAT family N-acetyltransferase [Rickettsiales bacterium]